jgi:hypothetical protein
MDVEDYKNQSLNFCMHIATEYTREEVERFFPKSFLVGWDIGNDYLQLELKKFRKRSKNLTF